MTQFNMFEAIAKMDLSSPLGLDYLKTQYPQLDFVFAELEELRADVTEMVPSYQLDEAQREAQRLYDLVDEAETRFAQLRALANTLARFDGSHAVRAELRTIALKADDAQVYCMKRKDA